MLASHYFPKLILLIVSKLSFITNHGLCSLILVMSFSILTQVAESGDSMGSILQIVYLFSFLIFMFYGQKFQTWMMLREIQGAVVRLRTFRDEAKKTTITTMQEFGNKDTNPTPRIEQFMEFFAIMPSSLDPAGIVPKIQHLVKVEDKRVKSEIILLAPAANEVQRDNLEGVLAVATTLNTIYRVVNHFYLTGKKSMSLYAIVQIQMQLPQIMQVAQAYNGFLKAFVEGQPVGDGAGALVAAKLMYGHPSSEIARDMVVANIDLEGRKLIVMKAKGPGSTVGKPGEALEKTVEEAQSRGDQVSMILMVDAGQKYEGEKSGGTSEGIGAAIGGIGVEAFEIEAVSTKYAIPLYAVKIKESIEESMNPMTKEISEGTDVALAKVKKIILEGTKVGDLVIVAGIGNTVGVGQ